MRSWQHSRHDRLGTTPVWCVECVAATIPLLAEVFRAVDVTRIRSGARSIDVDCAATEEPLDVRVNNPPFAVVMRTPGADRDLAAGFLLAEGVLKSEPSHLMQSLHE